MTSDATVRNNDSAADPEELDEWSESFDQLLAFGGQERAAAVLRRLGKQAADAGLDGYESSPPTTSTPSRWRTSPTSPAMRISRGATAA